MWGTDFNQYVCQLAEANVHLTDIYRSHKLYSHTRMTNGTVLDFFPSSMDMFHALAVSRSRNISLAGLSERIPKVYLDPPHNTHELTHLCSPFFDMDIELPETPHMTLLTQAMVEQFVNTVLFAGFRDFFQLGSTCGALHLAIYSPIENDTIQPSICTVLLCGWCSTTPLRNTMWNTQPVAECQTCGLRFPRSIGASNVGPMFVMASSIKLLEQYNKVHPCRLRYLRRPDPWQSVDDLEYDAATNRVSFLVNTQRVSVVLPRRGAHIVKRTYKYSIHIKAMHSTHANITKARKQNDLACKRYAAFRRKYADKPDSHKDINAFVNHEIRRRTYLNAQSKTYEAPALVKAYARTRVPRLFDIPIYEIPEADVELFHHLLDENTLRPLAVTQEMFLYYMSYIITRATSYQSSLPDNHPLKRISMKKALDPKPLINGAALRLCFGKLNEPKPIRCKCTDIPANSRKRSARGSLLASRECAECHGKGHYMDTSRNPTQLLRVLVDPGHARYTELQSTIDTHFPRLNDPKNLAILLACTSTRLNQAALRPEWMCADLTPAIDKCMVGVPPNLVYKKSSLTASGARVGDVAILDTVQKYIRETDDLPQWAEIVVTELVPWGTQQFPRYRVNVNECGKGSQWCVFKNNTHRSNTVYFVLDPPRRNGQSALMYAACWSSTCPGYWRNTPIRDRKVWSITPRDAAIIWPGLNIEHLVRAPTLTDALAHGTQMMNHGDPDAETLESANPTIHVSFREHLSRPSDKRFITTLEYYRSPKARLDVEPVLLRAFRVLGLVGV